MTTKQRYHLRPQLNLLCQLYYTSFLLHHLVRINRNDCDKLKILLLTVRRVRLCTKQYVLLETMSNIYFYTLYTHIHNNTIAVGKIQTCKFSADTTESVVGVGGASSLLTPLSMTRNTGKKITPNIKASTKQSAASIAVKKETNRQSIQLITSQLCIVFEKRKKETYIFS